MAIGRKYERDVDLMLAEEFMVSAPFANWFLNKTKFAGSQSTVMDVSVSKVDATGESDLVVLYKNETDSTLFAIHIEDKIDAPLQPEQEARYRQRAEGDIRRGEYNDYELILCAPRFYAANQVKSEYFDRFVSYEEMAEFIALNDALARGQYRSDFLLTATSRRLNIWQKNNDELTNSFWSDVYKLASRDFVILEMKEPNFTKGQTWINFRPHQLPTMPRRIYVSFKGERGHMDLTFSSCVAHKFEKEVRSILEPDMSVHQTGKSAAIRLAVDGFKIQASFEAESEKVRNALLACERLINFFICHRESLMAAVKCA